MGALSGKTILLVTHQVDFLPAFDLVLVSFIHAVLSPIWLLLLPLSSLCYYSVSPLVELIF